MKLFEDDSALVVSWFRAVKALVTTAFCFVVFGKMVDMAYIFVHSNEGLYLTSTISTVDSLYTWFGFTPLITLIMVMLYIINYSIWSSVDGDAR